MPRPRTAVLNVAQAVVACPYCDEPQPSPGTGGDLWIGDEILAKLGPVECFACWRTFTLTRSRFTLD